MVKYELKAANLIPYTFEFWIVLGCALIVKQGLFIVTIYLGYARTSVFYKRLFGIVGRMRFSLFEEVLRFIVLFSWIDQKLRQRDVCHCTIVNLEYFAQRYFGQVNKMILTCFISLGILITDY